MTKARLWDHIAASNPAMSGITIRLRSTELKRLFDMVWDVATRAAMDERRAGMDVPDVLKGLFNGR